MFKNNYWPIQLTVLYSSNLKESLLQLFQCWSDDTYLVFMICMKRVNMYFLKVSSLIWKQKIKQNLQVSTDLRLGKSLGVFSWLVGRAADLWPQRCRSALTNSGQQNTELMLLFLIFHFLLIHTPGRRSTGFILSCLKKKCNLEDWWHQMEARSSVKFASAALIHCALLTSPLTISCFSFKVYAGIILLISFRGVIQINSN